MVTDVHPARERTGVLGAVSRHPLISFFVMANALSWIAWIPYILSEQGLGIWQFSFPAVLGTTQITGMLPGAYLGPITSALIITLIADGRVGLRRWAARLPPATADAPVGAPVTVVAVNGSAAL